MSHSATAVLVMTAMSDICLQMLRFSFLSAQCAKPLWHDGTMCRQDVASCGSRRIHVAAGSSLQSVREQHELTRINAEELVFEWTDLSVLIREHSGDAWITSQQRGPEVQVHTGRSTVPTLHHRGREHEVCGPRVPERLARSEFRSPGTDSCEKFSAIGLLSDRSIAPLIRGCDLRSSCAACCG